MTGRVLGVDVGARRVGLAISDASGTLARPLYTIAVSSEADAVDRVAERVDALARDEDGLAAIVVGMPSSLEGKKTPESLRVAAFVAALAQRTPLAIAVQDERLTSVEAESRLAMQERDWKKRKEKLDAAAAAIILQDYLDSEH